MAGVAESIVDRAEFAAVALEEGGAVAKHLGSGLPLRAVSLMHSFAKGVLWCSGSLYSFLLSL
jgi:hypothetical protein